MIWGHKWKGSTVTAHCDNKVVVCILNSRHSRDDYLMRMLRILFFKEAHFQFELHAKHIPGVSNTSTDYLSRENFTLNCCMQTHTNHMFLLLFYSHYWTPNWTGRLVAGPRSSVPL